MTGPRPRVARFRALAIAVGVAGAAIAAAPTAVAADDAAAAPPVFRGGWIATIGANSARPFHGEWSAQALPGRPDDVQGSWSLVDPAGDIKMKGTWSARRAKRGLKGTWSARLPDGGVLSGTFEANVPKFKGKTFTDLLAATQAAQIAGSWRMGPLGGNWWLKGLAAGTAP